MTTAGPFSQAGYRRTLDWGPEGLARLAPGAEVVVVVDVLRFCTCVDVVVAGGGSVRPTPGAAAGGTAGLSPVALADLGPGADVTIASPNGAALAVAAARLAAGPVVAGCLRNAGAVGRAAAAMAGAGVVAVVAAGEREPPPGAGTRFALEDLLGAGAVLAAAGTAGASPEALAAVAAFQAAAHDLPSRLLGCGSGRELAERGIAADVAVAADLDAGTAVPVLRDGAFAPLQ